MLNKYIIGLRFARYPHAGGRTGCDDGGECAESVW